MNSAETPSPMEDEVRKTDGVGENPNSESEDLDSVLKEVEADRKRREDDRKLMELAISQFASFGLTPARGSRYPVMVFEAAEPMAERKVELLAACRQFSLTVESIRNIEVNFLASDVLGTLSVNFGEEAKVSMYSDIVEGAVALRQEGAVLFIAHSHPADPEGKYQNEQYSAADLRGFIDASGISQMYIFTPTGSLILRKTKNPQIVRQLFRTAVNHAKSQGGEFEKKFVDLMLNSQKVEFERLPEAIRNFFEMLGFRFDFEKVAS